MSRILVVEGICGSGKTTFIKSIEPELKHRGLKVGILDQKTTYLPLVKYEDTETLDDTINIKLLRKIVSEIKETSLENDILIVDSLHITQYIRPGVLSTSSFAEIDEIMVQLKAKVLFLKISRESIEKRISGRKNTSFFEYAKRFGKSIDEVCEYFSASQLKMLDSLINISSMDRIVYQNDTQEDLRNGMELIYNG